MQAASIVEYLHDLGITDCYTSPFLMAHPGSMHGYDVTDHTRFNPEIGSEEEFIAFAEQTGYVRAITRWVLERAITQCVAWRRSGLEINVSVNISARDVMDAELPNALAALLDGHGIPGAVFTTAAAGNYLAENGTGRDPGALPADPQRTWNAIGSLRQAGLLTVDPAGTSPTVRISPVIQAVIRAAVPDVGAEQRGEPVEVAVAVLVVDVAALAAHDDRNLLRVAVLTHTGEVHPQMPARLLLERRADG